MRRRTSRSPTGRPRISARARGRKHQLHQQLQRRRLAGAVGAEEAEDLAGLDRQRQAIERAVRTGTPEADRVVLRQLVDVDCGGHAESEGRCRTGLPKCRLSGRRPSAGTGFSLRRHRLSSLQPSSVVLSSYAIAASKNSGLTMGTRAPLMKKVGVPGDLERGAHGDVGLHQLERLGVLRVKVGDAADAARTLLAPGRA